MDTLSPDVKNNAHASQNSIAFASENYSTMEIRITSKSRT